MKKINSAERLDLLNIMQSFAHPDSSGQRQFSVSIQQLTDAMKKKHPNITLQNVHVLCRSLIKEKKIWCLDRGDETRDKSTRILTFGIAELAENPEILTLSVVERAAIVVDMLSEKIEGRAGLKNISKGMAIEIRQTIIDLMSEIQK